MRYAFIRNYSGLWPIRWLCDLLDVHPSGYYAWRRQPKSRRQKTDDRLTGLIKQFWLESGGVYGYRKIHEDLREYGERCGPNKVHRLMRLAGLKAQVGYRNLGIEEAQPISLFPTDYSGASLPWLRMMPG